VDRVDAVVVAAGSSARMGGGDKLSAMLLGRPVLAWSVEAMDVAGLVDRLILVAPAERLGWLDGEARLRDRVEVVPGGHRRQESVAAGVRAASARTVLVHDGARPLATHDLVQRVAEVADQEGAAVPVVPIAETVKRVTGDMIGETVPRDELALAQTPQGYHRDVLIDAWERLPPEAPDTWTDEASLLEALGVGVHAVVGEADNLKITVASDLERAERTLASRTGAPIGAVWSRAGLGRDSHPFGPGDALALGGIRIPGAPALGGHSDGDVALHALADALLGAAALGDLGRLFPAGEPATRGIPSDRLVREVLGRLAEADVRPVAVDLTIIAARPHLGAARLDAMRTRIAELLGLGVDRVSVKASTGNLSGDEGAGRVISAQAVATVATRQR
jgi:2-C-methyl-D-erythritol 4-phosphate cytidylyltransferase/2-C-methyl-D-erythritol 2,4-cyclodiphosphate synthase